MSLSHLSSPTDIVASQLNPGFNSLLVKTVSTLGTSVGTSGLPGVGSIYLPPASAPASLVAVPTAPISQYDEQALTAQAVGGALSGQTVTIQLRKIGRTCIAIVGTASGTAGSNATCTLPPLPAGYIPANGTFTAAPVQVLTGMNNALLASLVAVINSSGVIQIGVNAGTAVPGNFTSGAACSWQPFTFTYTMST